jgi:mRNA interferase MazF
VICKFGDVVVVPFPFVDLPVAKNRPALVLSSSHFNEANGHTVLVMITTAARSSWPSDHSISDISSAGLTHPSSIRWKLFTLPNRLILRAVGELGASDSRTIAAAARSFLASP